MWAPAGAAVSQRCECCCCHHTHITSHPHCCTTQHNNRQPLPLTWKPLTLCGRVRVLVEWHPAGAAFCSSSRAYGLLVVDSKQLVVLLWGRNTCILLHCTAPATAECITHCALHCSSCRHAHRCCHHAGADPADAQRTLADMCDAAGGLLPDGTVARLLTAIDVGWQQLNCGQH